MDTVLAILDKTLASEKHSGPASITQAEIEVAFSAEEIAERVKGLAARITKDLGDDPVVAICVLKGAWVFMADLVRELARPIRCDFVRLTSYGDGTTSSGAPKLLLDVTTSLDGQTVLVVDDIIDTGHSLAFLHKHLRSKGAARVQSCVLLDKPARRTVDIQPNYVGFEIADRFVVGYGIDYAERYRELPYVGYVETSEDKKP